MSEVTKREPVDNSHRDAGIAARDSRKEAEAKSEVEIVEKVAEQAAEDAIDDAGDGDDGTDTQNTEESADSEQEGARSKPRNRGVGKRIDELTKEKYDAQRERDHWRELALRGQGAPEPQPAQAAERATEEPTLESCDFDPVKFQREWYSYQRAQEKKQEAAQAKQQKLAEREAEFRTAHPDYDTVARNPTLPITQQVAEVILETDDPPAIAYYLGQNPEEAAAIAQMTPHQIGRAIGRIEAKLSAPPASDASRQPAPRTVTRAPGPVTTLSGAPAVKKTYEGMSMKEYDEARKKERAAKGLSNR